MWTPYKQLQKIIDFHLAGHSSDTSELEIVLRKYKQNFINLLKNSVSLVNFSLKTKNNF